MKRMNFDGIDYTFRHTLNNLINNTQQKNSNNINKINQDEDYERKRRKYNLKIQKHISDL